MGPLDINLFAARHNTQLPRFFSYRPDPMAEAVDALSQEWTNLSLYAFPPFILLGRVLRKIRTDKVHQAVLLAPIWPNQHWYPLLLEMITDFPVTLPQLPDLLESPAGDPHPLIEEGHLRLAAWKVSNKRPPMPKYTSTWDVSTVVQYVKEEMDNTLGMNIKHLSMKLVVLLALSNAPRASDLAALDTRFMQV
jgi:hypothetical protein